MNSDIIRVQKSQPLSEKFSAFLGLVIFSIFINFIGSFVANTLELPVYLDLIGTMIAAMMGGAIPGILVGLLSPVITTFTSDPNAISYSMLNVMIAVVTTWFYNNGWFTKLRGVVIAIILDSIIGGMGGAIITMCIYGFQAETTSSSLVQTLYGTGIFSAVSAEIFAGFIVDFLDKVISVSLAVAFVTYIPENLRRVLKIQGWRQTPLTTELINELKKKRSRQISLRIKLVGLIALASAVIGIAAIVISYYMYFHSMIEREEEFAIGTAQFAASMVDGNRVDEFMERGEAVPGYSGLRSNLANIRKSSEYIEYIYVYKIMKDGCHVVFDIETDGQPAADVGEVIPFDESFLKYVPTLLAGGEIEPIISNDSYGWLLTTYEPIKDSFGRVRAYVGIDISMNQLAMEARIFLLKVISTFVGIFALILAAGLYFAEYQVILPLNTMAYSASMISDNKEQELRQTAEMFHRISIETGDETENLYRAFSDMTDDNIQYFEAIKKKNEMISKMQNSLILVLADMVESRDANTGDHVKKTAEYTKVIMDEMMKEGIYTDQLTDKFVSDVIRSAPLHDIGKISIPDMILNKPDKLDDNEYETMKTHTTEGAQIIDRVIATVPSSDSGYLNEARNLALYHHEKWDGKGYPTGISGEDIPLSARIMAVADVFDALVSNRSYKRAFPFEKAISIIRESSGTHFDPYVAQAFLNVEDKVREIANKNTA
ncbi:MAG: HD domain-containing protein [Butyrivibrio sp.]|nr:HD domain-containing protein [Butyrivibrio sp.]